MNIDDIRVKMERRKQQPVLEREPHTREEAQAIVRYCKAKLRKAEGTRAERKAANKAAWASGDRSRWGGERRSGQ